MVDVDLEKAIMEGKDTPALVQAIAAEERNPLVPADLHVGMIEGGAVARFAAKMNDSELKNRPLYLRWLFLAASVMVLTNHVFPDGGDDGHGAAQKEPLIILLLVAAKFALLLCATCLVFRTMKQMK